MLREDIRDAWVADLRSGETNQAGRALKGGWGVTGDADSEGYCCLGRLACVLRDQFPEVLDETGYAVMERPRSLSITRRSDGDATSIVIPEPLARAIGLDGPAGYIPERLRTSLRLENPRDLGLLNDKGFSFTEIADVIEQM